MTTANDILKQIKDNDVKFVDLRFTDPKGKLHHLTMDVGCVDEDMFADGVMFDGSSIGGWKAINESDMVLMPDPATVHMDPFFAQSTMVIVCDILDPVSGEAYNRDPRGIAKKAEAYLKASGIGDTVFVGPEPEFFVFDDVKYKADPYNTGFKLDSSELPSNDDTDYETGNLGHRPRVKGGYFPVPPIDSCQDMRSEMLTVLTEMASPSKSSTMKWPQPSTSSVSGSTPWCAMPTRCRSTNMSCTRSPTPMARRQPSCRSRSSAITARACTFTCRSGRTPSRPLQATNMPACRKAACSSSAASSSMPSRSTLFPIRRRTPTSVSYRVMKRRFFWPIPPATRSASCRIPFGTGPKSKRVEVRFPDPLANPYLAFAAMLMAGLDGIKNKIHPGKAMDKDLYDLPPKELKKIPTVCGSLREALENLDRGSQVPDRRWRVRRRPDRFLYRAEDGRSHAV